MKGIAHFISGVAAATFVPQIVHMSAEGSMIMLLAGVGGIMPDTLDFKLARYLDKPDVEIDPDPNSLDPQLMAERVAATIDRVYETGEPAYVQFHTIKLGADLWRQYSICFGGPARKVQVRIGPVVTTSQVPFPDSELGLVVGRASIVAPTHYTYETEIKVDIFSGPSFAFAKGPDGVEITFLPWHRRWSHSLTFAVLLGIIIGLILGPWYGLAYALGAVVHIVEDQLGYMGSNLLYPFTHGRVAGLRLFHSGDALPNFFAVWLGVWLILLNLDRFSSDPVFDFWYYILVGLVLPWTLIFGLSWWGRSKTRSGLSVGDAKIGEALAEGEEVEC
ncbi:MAG: metal-dependent hydrolase [Anaerolineae bacterium]|nr:metal-dependent hydrolase [Anaerolineae bacterium]